MCPDYPGAGVHGFTSICQNRFQWKQRTLKHLQLTNYEIDPPRLFDNLPKNLKPIAIPTRRYSSMDAEFIEKETNNLLTQGIIENSNSP